MGVEQMPISRTSTPLRVNPQQKTLRKRLSIRWLQASMDNPYTIKGTTLLKGLGLPTEPTKKGMTTKMLLRPVEGAITRLMEDHYPIIKDVHREEIKRKTGQTGRMKNKFQKIRSPRK